MLQIRFYHIAVLNKIAKIILRLDKTFDAAPSDCFSGTITWKDNDVVIKLVERWAMSNICITTSVYYLWQYH